MLDVLGWYGHGNVGDESYKICFPLLFPDQEINFVEKCNDKKNIVILGGGNVCSSQFLNQVELYENKKYAVSIGLTADDPVHRMSAFDKIWVRDRQSYELLKSKNIKSTIIPDVAFLMRPGKKDLLKEIFKGRDLYEKKVAVILNAYLCVGDNKLARDEATFNKLVFDLARTFDGTNASFVFLPFGQSQPHDDRIPNAWLAGKCKYWKKNAVVFDEVSPQTTLDIMSECDAVISMRLHSSIFSVVCGVPFIDITHHSKNSYFLKSIYKEDWSVSYWDFDRIRFSNLLQGLLAKQDHGLSKIVDDKRKILGELTNVHLAR